MRRRALRALGAATLGVVLAAHVGSPDVFFSGKAGPYDLRVIVRPPEVVPGVARVTVHAPGDVQHVFIRPVFWRAGSRGAPSADEMRRAERASRTFEGSLWLMARGAYTVDVIVEGARGRASVLVPVASVAIGRLPLSPGLGALLAVLAIVLCAALINIVYKAAGESLVDAGASLDAGRRKRARRVAAVAIPVLALAVFGGAHWWGTVDSDYQRRMYRPSPLSVSIHDDLLRLQATDTIFLPSGRVAELLPDHGKLLHLFLIRTDARAFAHLHPTPSDTTASPAFTTRLPPLPAGAYRVFGDVVQETGFERTLVASLTLDRDRSASTGARSDPDDGWYVGDGSRERSVALSDGSTMHLSLAPGGVIRPGREETIRVQIQDAAGKPAAVEPYLGMAAHAVVTRLDGSVYVHLHPMGTITMAAQDAFRARDRGDTTATGRLRIADDTTSPTMHASTAMAGTIEFPYAFPSSGSYRVFVQVKRVGRVLTGAFAITVADTTLATR